MEPSAPRVCFLSASSPVAATVRPECGTEELEFYFYLMLIRALGTYLGASNYF